MIFLCRDQTVYLVPACFIAPFSVSFLKEMRLMHSYCPRHHHNRYLYKQLGIQDKLHKPVDNVSHVLQKQVPQMYSFFPKA